jgi:hypothetical protein
MVIVSTNTNKVAPVNYTLDYTPAVQVISSVITMHWIATIMIQLLKTVHQFVLRCHQTQMTLVTWMRRNTFASTNTLPSKMNPVIPSTTRRTACAMLASLIARALMKMQALLHAQPIVPSPLWFKAINVQYLMAATATTRSLAVIGEEEESASQIQHVFVMSRKEP